MSRPSAFEAQRARSSLRRAVFLDRDGVLNIPEFRDGRSYAPRRLDAFRLYDDATPSVKRLKAAGFLVIVVTNQPDVSTGLLDRDTLIAMHRKLAAETGVDAIETCFSTRDAPCRRRKPQPGMLIDAALAGRIDLDESVMVGDRASDVQAGVLAGCETVFIDRGYTAEAKPVAQDATVFSLEDAVDWILSPRDAGDHDSRRPSHGKSALGSGARPKGASHVRLV